MITARDVIERFRLKPLAGEGGYFREMYRSDLTLPAGALPASYRGDRHAATAIFYLLTPDTHSAIHRLPGDEIYHFYLGDPVEMLQLHPDGAGEIIRIGNDLAAGMRPQVLVRGKTWHGSRLAEGGDFALMGTTMTPGFDPSDYTAGRRTQLVQEYPAYAELITALTPESTSAAG